MFYVVYYIYLIIKCVFNRKLILFQKSNTGKIRLKDIVALKLDKLQYEEASSGLRQVFIILINEWTPTVMPLIFIVLILAELSLIKLYSILVSIFCY